MLCLDIPLCSRMDGNGTWVVNYLVVVSPFSVRISIGLSQLSHTSCGLDGGVGSLAYACSGGRQDDREQCFDLRMMWRTNGAGELYAYLPLTDQNQKVLLAVPPQSIANPDFGTSVGRGSFTFTSGQWVTIAERIKLNDPASYNGRTLNR